MNDYRPYIWMGEEQDAHVKDWERLNIHRWSMYDGQLPSNNIALIYSQFLSQAGASVSPKLSAIADLSSTHPKK